MPEGCTKGSFPSSSSCLHGSLKSDDLETSDQRQARSFTDAQSRAGLIEPGPDFEGHQSADVEVTVIILRKYVCIYDTFLPLLGLDRVRLEVGLW